MTKVRSNLVKLYLNPSLRIYPPTEHTFIDWTVEDIVRNRRFYLSPFAVSVLIFIANPAGYIAIKDFLSNKFDLPDDISNAIITDLINKDLILQNLPSKSLNKDIFHASTTMREWRKFGWGGAADYHIRCYDYPFLEEKTGGYEIANQRMSDYSEEEPDTQRFKVCEPVANVYRILPKPDASLFQEPAHNIFIKQNNPQPKKLLITDIIRILAMTVGVIERRAVNWIGEPLLRKTTPSGGSRHPTEAYLFVRTVKKMDPGYYHAQVSPLQLVRMKKQANKPFELVFPRMSNDSPFDVCAVIVLTTVFERNMYRYREPRTFRTVHMDAGHIVGTITALANLAGIKTFVQYGAADKETLQELNLNKLQEGVQACVGLGY